LPAKNVNWAIISDTPLDKREDLLGNTRISLAVLDGKFQARRKRLLGEIDENSPPETSRWLIPN
jgi:hypothetical protein